MLIKLRKPQQQDGEAELKVVVSYDDADGKHYSDENTIAVSLAASNPKGYYSGSAIRKAIALARYLVDTHIHTHTALKHVRAALSHYQVREYHEVVDSRHEQRQDRCQLGVGVTSGRRACSAGGPARGQQVDTIGRVEALQGRVCRVPEPLRARARGPG